MSVEKHARKYMSKRQRACDNCRLRKTACRIEASPPCRACASQSIECTFLKAAPYRNRRFYGEVATHTPVEISAISPDTGQASSHAHQSIHNVNPGFADMDQMTPWQFDLDDFGNDMLDQQIMFESPNAEFHGTEYGLSQSSANQFSDGTWELQDCDPNACVQILGESTDMSPSALQYYRYDESGRYKFKQLVVQAVTEKRDAVHFLVSPRILASTGSQNKNRWLQEAEQLRSELGEIVSFEIGSRLIMLCHEHISPHYPIFSLQQWPSVETSSTGLLAAIYLAVQPFIKLDDRLAVDLAYEAPQAFALSQIVQQNLESMINTPDLSTIQTLLLMVLQPSTNPVVSDGSLKASYMGLLVSAAQTLGLHLDAHAWTIAPWQIAHRRRLSHVIYTADKWLACALGRPPLLNRENWLVTSLTTEDCLDSGLNHAMWSEQLNYSELCDISSAMLSDLFSLRGMRDMSHDYRLALTKARPLLERLTAWQKRGQTDDPTGERPTLTSISNLGAHFVRVSIFKAIICQLQTSEPSSLYAGHEHQEAQRAVRTELLSAITAAASFLRNLRQEEFRIFWPAWAQRAFSAFTFVSLSMAIGANTAQEASEWFQTLKIIRKQLRIKAEFVPILQLGILRIDAVFWSGPKKVLAMRPHVEQAFDEVYGIMSAG